MQKGTRVKVIDEQACIRMFADVKKGDKGTCVDNGYTYDGEEACSIQFDNATTFIVVLKALKRLHVKKVEV